MTVFHQRTDFIRLHLCMCVCAVCLSVYLCRDKNSPLSDLQLAMKLQQMELAGEETDQQTRQQRPSSTTIPRQPVRPRQQRLSSLSPQEQITMPPARDDPFTQQRRRSRQPDNVNRRRPRSGNAGWDGWVCLSVYPLLVSFAWPLLLI